MKTSEQMANPLTPLEFARVFITSYDLKERTRMMNAKRIRESTGCDLLEARAALATMTVERYTDEMKIISRKLARAIDDAEAIAEEMQERAD